MFSRPLFKVVSMMSVVTSGFQMNGPNAKVITVHDGETYSSDDYDPLSGAGVVITCIDGWLQYTDRNGSSSCKNANMNGKIYVAAVTKQSRSTKGGSSTSVSSPPSSYRNGGASQGN